jgi:hypothetical protein
MGSEQPSTFGYMVRGLIAGLAGTLGMTAVQKLAEMPITGREDSDAPAQFAEKVLPMHVEGAEQHKRINYLAHYAIGATWGGTYGLVARTGLRGWKAVAVAFGIRYAGDILLGTALRAYKPSTWSIRDVAVDLVNKSVQVTMTGMVFEHSALTPRDR